ncbi:MAG: hypothetical protein IKI71_04630, partial [Lachnospiraceae bacterium]|nr:hypothetical protein [Lachnospiraceae bacterium]
VGGGGRIAADSLPTTLPNGQPLTQAQALTQAAAEPVTTVTAAGVAETVSTDAATGITSTVVSLNFNTNSVVHDTANSNWVVDAGG